MTENAATEPTRPFTLPFQLELDGVRVVEANEKGLGAYTGHYGVRIKHDHPSGTWSLVGDVWSAGGPDASSLWPDMSGPSTLKLTPRDLRVFTYAVGAADGMQRVVNRLTAKNRRASAVDAHASGVISSEGVRAVVTSGMEALRVPGRERLTPETFTCPVSTEPLDVKDEVAFNPDYLVDIAERVGPFDDLELWVYGPLDAIGIRGARGEAVLMPERL